MRYNLRKMLYPVSLNTFPPKTTQAGLDVGSLRNVGFNTIPFDELYSFIRTNALRNTKSLRAPLPSTKVQNLECGARSFLRQAWMSEPKPKRTKTTTMSLQTASLHLQ
eukprot:g71823.t1